MYSLKIVNPNNTGGELIVNDLGMPEQATSVEELKAKVCELFSKYTEGYDTQFRYIVPGHGMKGKQEKIDCWAHMIHTHKHESNVQISHSLERKGLAMLLAGKRISLRHKST